MILELIPVSRLRRELNRVIRNLANGNPDVYIVSRRGERVAYLVAPDLFHAGMQLVDHADLDAALRAARQLAQRAGGGEDDA